MEQTSPSSTKLLLNTLLLLIVATALITIRLAFLVRLGVC